MNPLIQRLLGALIAGVGWLSMAPVALGHTIVGTWDSPVPLVAYVAGAGATVAASFVLVMSRAPAARSPRSGRARGITVPRPVVVPRAVVTTLRVLGIAVWSWVVLQAVTRGLASNAVAALFANSDVSSVLLWVYGWVGVALVCAFVAPVWTWLDPFSTLYDLGALVIRQVRPGLTLAAPDDYPAWLGKWPAVAGFVFFIWLEIGVQELIPPVFALLGYTAITLAGMALYGPDTWRDNAETFGVWFGTVGRLAPLQRDGTSRTGVLQRRPFTSGLHGDWTASEVALVGIATFAVLFDAVSQTKPLFAAVGATGSVLLTLTLPAWVPVVAVVVLRLARTVGRATLGAALTPVAVGYLLAHYLTFLLFEGQRILVAVSDPLGLGWDVLGTTFYRPTLDWLPAGVIWAVQLTAVVGGHVVGAVAGHRSARTTRQDRRSDLILAVVMVPLTSMTLWALGQTVIRDPSEFQRTVSRAIL